MQGRCAFSSLFCCLRIFLVFLWGLLFGFLPDGVCPPDNKRFTYLLTYLLVMGLVGSTKFIALDDARPAVSGHTHNRRGRACCAPIGRLTSHFCIAVAARVYICVSSLSVFNKKAQLMLAYPRDAKRWKKFRHFEVITSSSQVGNPVFIVIKFLIQITSTYNS